MKISQVIIQLNNFNDEYLVVLKQEFNNLNQNIQFYVQGQVDICEWEIELNSWNVEYLKGEDYITEKIDFLKYYHDHLNGFTSLIDDSLIQVHLNFENKKFIELVNSLIKQLKLLLDKKVIKEIPYLNVFEGKITELISTIARKYLENYSPEPSKFIFEPKIKYLGTLNMLSTFFLKYSESNNNLKKAIFERDVKAFKNLLILCFVDSNGNQFSSSTLDTYFNKAKSLEKWNDLLEIQEPIEIIDTQKPEEAIKGS